MLSCSEGLASDDHGLPSQCAAAPDDIEEYDELEALPQAEACQDHPPFLLGPETSILGS